MLQFYMTILQLQWNLQGIQEINWEQGAEEDVDVAGVAVWEYRV